MWFLIVALVSIVSSLILGRVLARARVERTSNPFAARGPSFGAAYPARRDAVAHNAVQRRLLGAEVQLN